MIFQYMPSGVLGANCYFVGDEKSKKGFIVDPGGHKKDMVNQIKDSGCELEYIILTHGHCDHIAGVESYKELFPNVKVIASKYEKEVLIDPNLNLSKMFGAGISMEADLWVADGETMTIGNMEVMFIHTPGHTPGGMCILVDDILLSGDTLFRQSVGRTDFPGGSLEQLRKSIKEKLFILPEDTKVFPGHMSATTIGFEKRGNPFV